MVHGGGRARLGVQPEVSGHHGERLSPDSGDLRCGMSWRAVLETAYRADPARFLGTWRAETGAGPPRWLTGDGTGPP
jgi:hypothetical protein